MTTTHEPLLIDREEETFWDEKRRKSSLGYRMNLLARAQAKLRAAGEAELADGLDELHSELWFWKNGMHRPDEASAKFQVEQGAFVPQETPDAGNYWRCGDSERPAVPGEIRPPHLPGRPTPAISLVGWPPQKSTPEQTGALNRVLKG